MSNPQERRVSFSITLVPCRLTCLTTFIVSRALADNAFDPPFKSIAEILERPHLEDVDYLPLKWKEEFLDPDKEKKIIPIQYSQYNKLWHLTITAAGFREDMRPSSMRVGAGARLGEFEPYPRPWPWLRLITNVWA